MDHMGSNKLQVSRQPKKELNSQYLKYQIDIYGNILPLRFATWSGFDHLDQHLGPT